MLTIVVPHSVSAQIAAQQTVDPDQASTAPATTSIAAPADGLFSGLLTDFKNLPSKENLIILSVGGATSFAGHQFDTRIVSTFPTSPSLDSAARTGNEIGSLPIQLGTALATYALGKSTHNSTITTLGSELFRAQVVSGTLTQGLKFATQRTRPDGTPFSFPSGHTSSSFATATVFERTFGWKVGVPAYGIASWVAASRMESKRHYLSDVAFGAAIGIVAGRTVTIGRGDARFALSPAVAPGGGSVNFTWVGKQ